MLKGGSRICHYSFISVVEHEAIDGIFSCLSHLSLSCLLCYQAEPQNTSF